MGLPVSRRRGKQCDGASPAIAPGRNRPFLARNELVDLDCAGGFQREDFELVFGNFEIAFGVDRVALG